jgi:hypothetical protein
MQVQLKKHNQIVVIQELELYMRLNTKAIFSHKST